MISYRGWPQQCRSLPLGAPEKRALVILALIMIMATVSFFLPGIRLMDGGNLDAWRFPYCFLLRVRFRPAQPLHFSESLAGLWKVLSRCYPVLFFAVLVACGFGVVSSFFIQ
jgi:hypothetical protein